MYNIGNRQIGDGAPCFITFEIGPTHNGVESAKRLIKRSAEAGADAVKVQILDPDRLISDKGQLFSYGVLKDRSTGEVETVQEPLYDIMKRRSLSDAEWREVKSYCDEMGLAFFATVGFDEEVDLLVGLGCESIKIASADVSHRPLLRRAGRTGMCIQLDTGKATLGEIEAAVDVIRQEGNENIIIHHCPSGYPAHLESVNLNIIPTLKRMFPYPIAFSDHSPGNEMDIAAVALGANLIEKTITEDRMTRSVEHIISLELSELDGFVKTIRSVEIAMGSNRREMHPEELRKRDATRRGAFLRSDGKAGDRLADCDVDFRRPGYGIQPDRFDELQTAVLVRDLPAGQMLRLSDLAWD